MGCGSFAEVSDPKAFTAGPPGEGTTLGTMRGRMERSPSFVDRLAREKGISPASGKTCFDPSLLEKLLSAA